jgi:D-glycero-alpha-D-manno-heptose-7-phosphate kinase
LGQEAKQYLLQGKVDDFGATFHRHWLIKKKLSRFVSNPAFDSWYEQGIKAGSLGGKIIGAGGGGWFVFYVNKHHASFCQHMKKIGLEPQFVRFDWQGTKLLIKGDSNKK